METCPICRIFIEDWFTQPLSPQHTLYGDIHAKRLNRVLPDVAPIFIRFIKGLTFYDITGVFFTIERKLIDATMDMLYEDKNVIDDKLLRLSWTVMTDHYIAKDAGEIRLIENILREACVCKTNEKELIGYYLTNMIVEMKDVHSSHVSKNEVPEPASTDTYITIGIGANRDELYD
jgi:hypothetical protein